MELCLTLKGTLTHSNAEGGTRSAEIGRLTTEGGCEIAARMLATHASAVIAPVIAGDADERVVQIRVRCFGAPIVIELPAVMAIALAGELDAAAHKILDAGTVVGEEASHAVEEGETSNAERRTSNAEGK